MEGMEDVGREQESEEEQDQEVVERTIAMAHRDQNDADVQEVARQVGVFCRGLDEADVKHGFMGRNQDRADAIQFFVLAEMGSLRSRQNEEDE